MADEPSKRDSGGRFVTGGPGGPGKKALPPEAIEALDANVMAAIETWVKALNATKLFGAQAIEHPDWPARISAAEKILDRRHGKAPQAITGEDGGPLSIDLTSTIADALKKLGG